MATRSRIIQILLILNLVSQPGIAKIQITSSSYFYDGSGKISIDSIRRQIFKPYQTGMQIPVVKGSHTWFFISIPKANTTNDLRYVFTNAHRNEDLLFQLELFNHSGQFLGKCGDWIRKKLLSYPANRMVLELPAKDEFDDNYLLCLTGLTKGNIRPLDVQLLAQSEVSLIPLIHKGHYSQMMIITYGIFWGVIILCMILVGFQYIQYRERSYGYYLLYLIFLSLLYLRTMSNPFNGLATIHGIYGKYFYSAETWIQYLTFAFYIYFVYYFLDLHQSSSERLRKTFIHCANFFLLLAAIDIPLQIIFGLEFGHTIFNQVRMLFFPLPLILIFILWRQNRSLFIYILLLGTILVALPSLFTAFSNWGEGVIGFKKQDRLIRLFQFYDSNLVIPMYHTRIGICLEILCFTVALGYKNQWNLNQLEHKIHLPPKPIGDPVVESLQKLILTNLEQDFDLDQICENLHLSRSKLHDRVKSETGKSTSIFIRSLRLEEARKLLFSTKHTIAEIAYQVGFKDPNYFTRTFTQEFGVSPKRMREGN